MKSKFKKTWQMTKNEYENKYGTPRTNTTITGDFSKHKSDLEIALNRGLPVPLEVLRDYPDLMKSKFIIKDWAGNTMNFGEFKTFEDAWGYLYERFDHLNEKEFDEQMGEFEVIERST